MNKMHRVSLTETQTISLQKLTKKGILSTSKFVRAEVLLLVSKGMTDKQIAARIRRSVSTVERTRKLFAKEGLDCALKQKPRKGRPPKLNAADQEFIIKLVQGAPPAGYARWTGKLVCRRVVDLNVVKSISLSTIYRCLRAKRIKLNQRKTWCLSKFDDKFLEKGKKVIETYHKPYDPAFPVVCFDEKSYELKSHVRQPLPVAPGKPMREDNEWKRHGTANIFMTCEPKTGKRRVKVTKRRTKKDFARCMKQIVKMHPNAIIITVVLDNLNTHTKQAIIDYFGEVEGAEIANKLEFVHTPIHSSWLNMAEIELSALSSQSLDRRIPDKKTLNKEIKCWTKDRNKLSTPINWKFSVDDLYRLFEKIQLKRSLPETPSSTRQN